MKRITLILICKILLINGFGQLKINGFGKIQLGMKIEEIPEIWNPTIISNSQDYIKYIYHNELTSTPYELRLDSTEDYSIYAKYDNRVRSFYLGIYNINEDIQLEKISLNFFNEKLYEIIVEGDGINELLKSKYGKPKSTYKEVPKTFVNGIGIKFIKKNQTFTDVFNTNIPNVSCVYKLESWYTYKGEKEIKQETIIKNLLISKQVEIEVSKMINRIKLRKEIEKKNMLKDF